MCVCVYIYITYITDRGPTYRCQKCIKVHTITSWWVLNICYFQPYFLEMIQIDQYVSNRLVQPPTGKIPFVGAFIKFWGDCGVIHRQVGGLAVGFPLWPWYLFWVVVSNTPWKFNSLPLKSYRNPIGKDPSSNSSIFQWRAVKLPGCRFYFHP